MFPHLARTTFSFILVGTNSEGRLVSLACIPRKYLFIKFLISSYNNQFISWLKVGFCFPLRCLVFWYCAGTRTTQLTRFVVKAQFRTKWKYLRIKASQEYTFFFMRALLLYIMLKLKQLLSMLWKCWMGRERPASQLYLYDLKSLLFPSKQSVLSKPDAFSCITVMKVIFSHWKEI